VPGEQVDGSSRDRVAHVDGDAVIVTIGSAGIGAALVAALRARGVDAIAVSTNAADSRTDLAALFSLASPGRPLGAVVHAHLDAGTLASDPLAGIDDDTWDERCESQVRHAIHVFQAAFDVFGPGAPTGWAPRRLVAVVPTIAILGAPGLVPLATAVEGIRALVKSTGRQWGPNGITANCVAIPLEASAEGAPTGPVVATPSLPPTADPVEDAADAVAALLGPAGAVLNGQTLIADRGTVMV
jgi:3-oxoacyl-[acyl-carrier protein] reductase